MHYVLSTITLLAVGYAAWTRRKSWRSYTWQQVLTLGVILQGIGYVLCCTQTRRCIIGRALFAMTGISHVRDFLGHMAFLAGMCCVMCAVAYRIVPRERMEDFMNRIEVPGAVAALAMLTCLIFSSQTKQFTPADFVDVPLDGWLRAYWLILTAISLYFTGYMMRLLVILRRDNRSRLVADLFIGACTVGLGAAFTRVAAVVAPGLHIPVAATWTMVSFSLVMVSMGAALSWRRSAKITHGARRPNLQDCR